MVKIEFFESNFESKSRFFGMKIQIFETLLGWNIQECLPILAQKFKYFVKIELFKNLWENNKIKVFTRLFKYIEKQTIEATIWWIFFFGTFFMSFGTTQWDSSVLIEHFSGIRREYQLPSPSYQLGNYNTLQIFWDLFCTTVTYSTFW